MPKRIARNVGLTRKQFLMAALLGYMTDAKEGFGRRARANFDTFLSCDGVNCRLLDE